MHMSGDDNLVFSHQQLVSATFTDRYLQQFSAEACRFEQCRFDGTVIESASFGAGRSVSEYLDCSFRGAKLRMGPGGYARFVNCSFEEASIEHWFCFAVEIVGCTFSGQVKKAVFNGTVPEDDRAVVMRSVNQFERNDFSRAKLEDVAFRTGVDLTKQRLPVRDQYVYLKDAAAAVRRARINYDAWDDADAKRRAGGLLAVMEEDVADGQEQLFIRIDDYPRAARAAIRRLLTAAEGPDLIPG